MPPLESEEGKRKLRKIYRQNHLRMERTAFAILKDPRDTEDAVQSAWAKVIENFEKIFEIPCEKLPLWCVSIVKNEALTLLRKRRRSIPVENWERFSESESARNLTGYTDLVELFTHLPETYRAVLEMKLLLGYTEREIAERLGLSQTAVSTRVSRGRALLRKMLEEEGYVP